MFRKRVREVEAGDSAEKVKKKRKPMSPKKKKLLIAAGIIITIFVALIIVSKVLPSGSQPALQVSTGAAESMDIEQVVSIKGTIKGSESADVSSSLNYEIISILVHEGDIVKKGQVLAVLDAEALQNDYQKAARALEESKFNYDASKELYQQGAISEEEYLKAKNAYENDQNSLSTSSDVYDKTKIKSPINGTVTRVNVNIGHYANDTENQEPMFVVENLSKLKMDVKISEYDISKIKVGQKVTINAEMLGDQDVTGTVSRISPTGEKKDETSNEMVIPVQIDVDKGNTNLIAGVTAKATIEIEKKKDILSIPIDAVMEDPDTGDSYVMVFNGKTLKKVPVTLGLEGDFNIEIVSGKLSEGDQVVLNPTFDMKDGMEAAALPQE